MINELNEFILQTVKQLSKEVGSIRVLHRSESNYWVIGLCNMTEPTLSICIDSESSNDITVYFMVNSEVSIDGDRYTNWTVTHKRDEQFLDCELPATILEMIKYHVAIVMSDC